MQRVAPAPTKPFAQARKLLEPAGVRVYFGFSAAVNARGGAKARARTEEAMRGVPADRILLESDLQEAADVGRAMAEIVRLVAGARRWTPAQAVRTTAANAEEFYDRRGWAGGPAPPPPPAGPPGG